MSNWNALVDRCWAGAQVLAAEPLAGDASSRRYVRLHLRQGGAPASAIVMVLPQPTATEAPELPFLNVHRYLETLGIPVPRVWAARDQDLGLLLLEDLGDRPLAEGLADASMPPAERRRLLGETVDLLVGWTIAEPDAACTAYSRSHDETLIARELEMILRRGLNVVPGAPCEDEDRRVLTRLGRALGDQPRRFMHRDFHAWNLHIDHNGRVRPIDFQDAMLGPPAYDLASLCTDRDTHRFLTPADESILLETYARALAAAGSSLYEDRARLRHDYFTAVAFRTLRVLGRFRALAVEEDKPGYLQHLPAIWQQTRRAAQELEDEGLLGLLGRHAPEVP